MKRIKAVAAAVLILFSVSGFAGYSGAEVIETRALWVAGYDAVTREQIDTVLDVMVRSRMNVMMPCVFCHGWALWKSNLIPMRPGAPEGFDPLAYMIKRSHELGIQVHPWFAVMYVGARSDASLGPVLDQNPQFGVCGSDGVLNQYDGGMLWADPHNEKYRDFFLSLVREVAGNYDIDGIHLDYIRTGETRYYCEDRREEFLKRFGHEIEKALPEELYKFHGPAVGRIVSGTFIIAREQKPPLPVTAAVFTDMHGIKTQGQDPVGWIEQGILDVEFTMNYEMNTLMFKLLEDPFRRRIPGANRGVGISLYQMAEGKALPRDAAVVLEQVAAARASGADNLAFFASRYLSEDIIKALASGPFSSPAQVRMQLNEKEK